jgi:hypothetical protein
MVIAYGRPEESKAPGDTTATLQAIFSGYGRRLWQRWLGASGAGNKSPHTGQVRGGRYFSNTFRLAVINPMLGLAPQ